MELRKEIFVLVIMQVLMETVMSLECFKCANVTLRSGTAQLASLHDFLEKNNNPACGDLLNPDHIPTVTCPDDEDEYSTYQCGYVRADLTVYAHKVGRVEFATHIRDCIKVPRKAATGCYDNQNEVQTMVEGIMPTSVISTNPYGKVCFCQGSDCDVTLKDEDLQETFCTTGDVKIGNVCVDWWVFLIASMDVFLVMFIVTIITCCLCPCCPLYFHPLQTEREARALPLPPNTPYKRLTFSKEPKV